MLKRCDLPNGGVLYAARPDQTARDVLVVFPGGGYVTLTENENEVVADYFARRGFSAYVLAYSLQPNGRSRMPLLLQDVHEAVACLRRDHPGCRCFLVGFSAGGNLVLNYGNAYGDVEGLVSGYGVSDWKDLTRRLSADTGHPALNQRMTGLRDDGLLSLFGTTQVTDAQLDEISPVKGIHPRTPPTFLWHCSDDHLVPCEQSVACYSALRAQGVPAELHIFAGGEHGVGLAEDTPARDWKLLAERFLLAL